MDKTPPASDFTRLRRYGDRGAHDFETIAAIFDAAPTCHVGHVVGGRPLVLPTLHWRIDRTVYFHGSAASRMLETGAESEVCLTASLIDGFVLARCGFNHSVNYRSAVVVGRPRAVTDPAEKRAVLDPLIERFFPGRSARLRPSTEKEIKATLVLALPLTEASAKLRSGPPHDDEADLAWPVWAGVIPLHVAAGAAVADEGVGPELEEPKLSKNVLS